MVLYNILVKSPALLYEIWSEDEYIIGRHPSPYKPVL